MTYSVTALKLLFSTVDYFRAIIAGKLHIIENVLCFELPVNINRKHQHFAKLTFSTLRTHLRVGRLKLQTSFLSGTLMHMISEGEAELCIYGSGTGFAPR